MMAATLFPVAATNGNDIKVKNDELDKQFADNNLCSIDIRGDGNCYFCLISVVLYGNESHHAALRAKIG